MRSIKTNVLTGLPALLAAGFSVPAMATDQYIDTARVLSVSPQTARVSVPRQECRTEYQQQSFSNGQAYSDGTRSIAGAVIGGIAGGLLGNTVGRGSGRVAATAVGAGVGAIVGDRIGNNQYGNTVTTRSMPVEVCYQVDSWQTVNTGYYVTYEYNGRTYSTVTNDHPGEYITVNVAVGSNRHTVTQLNYIGLTLYNEPRWHKHGNAKHRGWDKHDRDNHGRNGRYY